jgi:hypothetical protein
MAADATLLAQEVARVFRKHVATEALTRIKACVQRLSEAQVWSRPNPASNAIGNLLLHLEGNVRQWIVVGLGGRPGDRDRDAEFAALGGHDAPDKDRLLAALEATVNEALAIVAAATPARLLAQHPFQDGRFPDTGIGGVLHVMEHFSGHAYQIYDRTKQLTAQDLRFYDL